MKRPVRWAEPWYAAFLLANLVMGTSSVLIPLKLDRGLDLGPTQLGVLSTLASLGAVVGSLLWGRLSDAVHRRKLFVLLSYSAVGLANIGLAFAATFHEMAIYNLLMSFFWVANASVAVLLVIEQSEQGVWESRISALNFSGAIGWLGGLLLGAFVVSPALSALPGPSGPRLVFLGLAGICVLAAILAALLIPAVMPRFTQRQFRGVMIAVGNLLLEAWRFNPLHLYHRFSFRRLRDLRKETRTFLAASALAFTGIGFFGVPLPMLLSQRLSYDPADVFLSYVLLHSGIVLAYPVALHRIRRYGNRTVQIGALSIRLVLFALGGLALWLRRDLPWPLVAVFLFLVGVTWSFFQLSGVTLASRLARPENRGLALGVYNAIAGGSTVLAGASSGYLVQAGGYHVSLLTGTVLLSAAVLLLFRLEDPHPLVSDSAELVERLAETEPVTAESVRPERLELARNPVEQIAKGG